MKNKTLSIVSLSIIGLLFVLGVSAFSNANGGLRPNDSLLNSQGNQLVDTGGIRAISSTDTAKEVVPLYYIESNESLVSAALEDEAVKKPTGSAFTHMTGDSPPVSTQAALQTAVQTVKPLIQQEPQTELAKSTRPGQKNPAKRAAELKPTLITYQDEMVIEFPEEIASTENLKRVVARILLSPKELKNKHLLSLDPIRSHETPNLYNKVRNQHGEPLRYPADVYYYVDYLLRNKMELAVDGDERFKLVHIPLYKNTLPNSVEKYQQWVSYYAKEFKVPADLVFAIIEVESAFDPRAVSKTNALGLMQIIPSAAGRDVYEYIDRKIGQPGKKELFDAEKNIRMGVAYMGLLKHEYFQAVRNEKIKEMLAISSYNGGMSTVLKLFGKTAEEAIVRINQLQPNQVYRTLRYEHQSDETRRYLDKVLQAKGRYQVLLETNV